MKVVCFAGAPIENNKGGPSGYLYLLRKSVDSNGLSQDVNIEFISPDISNSVDSVNSKRRFFYFFYDFLFAFYYFFSRAIKFRNLVSLNESKLSGVDIIHCHSVFDMFFIWLLTVRRYKANYVLTSHTPEPPYNEIIYQLKSKYGKSFWFTKLFLKVISDFSFKKADALIFPSKGAASLYFDVYPRFADLVKGKKIHYVYTCVDKHNSNKMERLVHRKESFKVGYLGRYNHVKGYDKFLELSQRYATDKIDFVSAGFGPISSKGYNVFDLGKISNPREYLNSIDLLVVPNRQTYFDIVCLEAIAQNTPLLLADNGGNSDLIPMCEGIFSLESDFFSDVVQKVSLEKEKISSNLELLYQERFSIIKFAPSIFSIYKELA